MNPFLYPPVAQPLPPDDWRLHAPFGKSRATQQAQPMEPGARNPSAGPRPSVRSGNASPTARQRTRRGWQRTACHVALAAGIGVLAGQGHTAPSVNANIATVQELQNIRGIGPKTAERIVRERERSGPFESFQDFAERIRGIGPKRAKALQEAGLTVSSSRARGPLPPGMR